MLPANLLPQLALWMGRQLEVLCPTGRAHAWHGKAPFPATPVHRQEGIRSALPLCGTYPEGPLVPFQSAFAEILLGPRRGILLPRRPREPRLTATGLIRWE